MASRPTGDATDRVIAGPSRTRCTKVLRPSLAPALAHVVRADGLWSGSAEVSEPGVDVQVRAASRPSRRTDCVGCSNRHLTACVPFEAGTREVRQPRRTGSRPG